MFFRFIHFPGAFLSHKAEALLHERSYIFYSTDLDNSFLKVGRAVRTDPLSEIIKFVRVQLLFLCLAYVFLGNRLSSVGLHRLNAWVAEICCSTLVLPHSEHLKFFFSCSEIEINSVKGLLHFWHTNS